MGGKPRDPRKEHEIREEEVQLMVRGIWELRVGLAVWRSPANPVKAFLRSTGGGNLIGVG